MPREVLFLNQSPTDSSNYQRFCLAQNKKKLTKDVRLVSAPWVLKRYEWWALSFPVCQVLSFAVRLLVFFFSKIQINLPEERHKTLLDCESKHCAKKLKRLLVDSLLMQTSQIWLFLFKKVSHEIEPTIGTLINKNIDCTWKLTAKLNWGLKRCQGLNQSPTDSSNYQRFCLAFFHDFHDHREISDC